MPQRSLSHTSWDCVYHVVWMPKRRRKVVYGQFRREIVGTMRDLVAREDGVGTAEGSACPDRIHLCLGVPPKHAVSKVVGRLKGRSPMILHGRRPELRLATGRDKTLWARGHCAGTVGLDEAKVREYVRGQEGGGGFEWADAPAGGATVMVWPARRGRGRRGNGPL